MHLTTPSLKIQLTEEHTVNSEDSQKYKGNPESCSIISNQVSTASVAILCSFTPPTAPQSWRLMFLAQCGLETSLASSARSLFANTSITLPGLV